MAGLLKLTDPAWAQAYLSTAAIVVSTGIALYVDRRSQRRAVEDAAAKRLANVDYALGILVEVETLLEEVRADFRDNQSPRGVDEFNGVIETIDRVDWREIQHPLPAIMALRLRRHLVALRDLYCRIGNRGIGMNAGAGAAGRERMTAISYEIDSLVTISKSTLFRLHHDLLPKRGWVGEAIDWVKSKVDHQPRPPAD